MKTFMVYGLLAIAAFATSCKTAQMQEKRIAEKEEMVAVVEDGQLSPAQTAAPTREVSFTSEDQEFEISTGEPIRIKYDNIDVNNNRLHAEEVPAADGTTRTILRWVPVRMNDTLTIHKLGARHTWLNPQVLPVIVLPDNIDKEEQIIITPLYNYENRRVGFEIRYGNHNDPEAFPPGSSRYKAVQETRQRLNAVQGGK